MRRVLFACAVLIVAGGMVADAQVAPQTQLYRNEPKGNIQYRRQGVMDGNLTRTIYFNTSEVAQYPYQPSGEWPKGSGHSYLDGVTILVGARVHLPGGRVISPIEAAYREEIDRDPVTNEIWGLEPVPGYINPSSQKPAVNIDPTTFPAQWPAALGLTPAWDGFWYGYFGRGITNADFETFFVVDDSKDGEFKRPPFNYYPIASDSARGGLGLRVEVRGFQWSHVLAEDVAFWHYDIVNISDRDYDSCAFGFYTDPGVGGTNNNGNSALFSRQLDICYAWSPSGLGVPGNWKTGYYGYAYLESPGNAVNLVDDDEDGLVDERRDDGIDNDGDWVPYADLNSNGSRDLDEPLNNDLGRDGVGPFDLQYAGPDEGEGDGRPTTGEPNFDQTDKDESDQIGLTAVALNILSDKGPTGVWPKNDDVMWRRMNNGFVDTLVQNTNIGIVFASGPFPLKKDHRERFSMALVFGNDLEDVLFNKVTVQNIYNANYNFSKPPFTPRVNAVAGDGRVYLYWDTRAEESRDPFLGYQNNDPRQGYKKDFEGYLVYRSTDAEFNDIKIITDSKGDPKYWKPIAQFDLQDTIKGPDPVGINGARFWRGNDTGLQHAFVDSTVQNGVRYYYAVVSYDQGDPAIGITGLQPTECTKIISEDFAGTLKFIDINCAVMTPNAAAAGYVPPQVVGDVRRVKAGLGTGSMSIQLVNPGAIQDGNAYKVLFNATGAVPSYRTSTYSVVRSPFAAADTLLKRVSAADFGTSKFSAPFDGLVFSFVNDTAVTVIDTSTGWTVGSPQVFLRVSPDNSNKALNVAWPADYEMRWFQNVVDTTAFDGAPRYPLIPVNFQVTNLSSGNRVKFIIDDVDLSTSLTFGDTIRIIDGYVNESTFKLVYKVTWGRGPGVNPQPPQPGDRFVIKTRRPFAEGDYFTFSTRAAYTEVGKAKNALDRIDVVPNPYVVSASWERRTLYQTGRGDRKIDFIRLPAVCVIRIYTVTGHLVKTLAKMSGADNGALSWDLVTEDGMDVAYGLYLYHVEAPGIGEHIGKFAVIK
jgi:hypothetical protein